MSHWKLKGFVEHGHTGQKRNLEYESTCIVIITNNAIDDNNKEGFCYKLIIGMLFSCAFQKKNELA